MCHVTVRLGGYTIAIFSWVQTADPEEAVLERKTCAPLLQTGCDASEFSCLLAMLSLIPFSVSPFIDRRGTVGCEGRKRRDGGHLFL